MQLLTSFIITWLMLLLLNLQVEQTQGVVKKEQGLAAKLQQEISAVTSNAQKQKELEQQKTEATAAEKQLIEKSLNAERQKVTC